MMIPASIKEDIFDKTGLRTDSVSSVGGGSIHKAVSFRIGDNTYFLKWNEQTYPDIFEKESMGLELLRSSVDTIIIPDVVCLSSNYLLLSYIESGNGHEQSSFRFGQQLAALHNHHTEEFGLDHDNYIGKLKQSNRKHTDWIDFFVQERIEPQLKMAIDSGELPAAASEFWQKLASNLIDIFPPAKPSLLHGDLWGGNYFFDKNGVAVLFDPAVYFGHPEMELAFTRMFGGFSANFYDGYASVSPIEAGFKERVPVYNLYPTLVHVNLFGGHYSAEAFNILRRFG
jgi:fructosamine-3-kinase